MRTLKLIISDNIDLNDYDLSMIIASKLYQDAKEKVSEIIPKIK